MEDLDRLGTGDRYFPLKTKEGDTGDAQLVGLAHVGLELVPEGQRVAA